MPKSRKQKYLRIKNKMTRHNKKTRRSKKTKRNKKARGKKLPTLTKLS
tara:strand:+ start:533 stop:676 length:144 start_codon:yes stop_codon:yes gene_type:complete